MMKISRLCSLAALVALAFNGCSLEAPDPTGGNIKIDLQNDATTQVPHDFLSALADSPVFDVLTTPTVVSDFNCFAVNVTGSGVSPNGQLNNCTVADNFAGKGMGVLSKLTTRGQLVVLEVPSGTERTIDVYGVYPTPSDCGGTPVAGASESGYLVGRKVLDIADSTSVTIPISFVSGTAASVTCTNSSNGGGSSAVSVALTAAGSNGCATYASPPTIPAPTGAIVGTAFTGPELIDAAAVNVSLAIKECTSGGPAQMHFIEYQFDASAYNLAQYSSFTIGWHGRAGGYSGGCTANPAENFDFGTGRVFMYRYDNGTTPAWHIVGTDTNLGTAIETRTETFGTPSGFAFSGNRFIVRVISASVNAADCAAVYTDAITLQLNP